MFVQPGKEPGSLARELAELNQIGAALSAERDTTRLLDLILTKAREITGADAGSLYVVEDAAPDSPAPGRRLRFKVAQNDSVAVRFHETTLAITRESIAGYVALTGEPVALDDAYAVGEDAPYKFDRTFDRADGYRTQSMVAVPMRTPNGGIVGVIQLINAMADGAVVPFSEHQIEFVGSVAAQAAVALENSQLYSEIRELFEGFVKASVVAIESRDPATSGHSFRVANLCVAFAEALDSAGGKFAAVRFSRDELRTIRYAALLHDFGKVGVPEAVLVKAKKLYPQQLELVRERFRLARRSRELASMQARLDFALREGAEAFRAREPEFDAELTGVLQELEQQLEDVEHANEPTVLTDGSFDRILKIAATTFPDVGDVVRPLLADEEVQLLSLRKGTLSPGERAQIEAHVLQSYRFLSQIPWTREIRRIPEITLGHHEKLNGTGYPHKLSAPDIPVQTRMMTISDIFDALAAADRPYKRSVPIERALDILRFAVKDGEIDPDLFTLFLEARVYDRWQVEPFPY